MKKEHKQVRITKDQKVWTQGHCQYTYIGICYPVHTAEIPILTSCCNTSLCILYRIVGFNVDTRNNIQTTLNLASYSIRDIKSLA